MKFVLAAVAVVTLMLSDALFAQDPRPVDLAPRPEMELCGEDANPAANVQDAYFCMVEKTHVIANCMRPQIEADSMAMQKLTNKIVESGRYLTLLTESTAILGSENAYVQNARTYGETTDGVTSLIVGLATLMVDNSDKNMDERLRKGRAHALAYIYLASVSDGKCVVPEDLRSLVAGKYVARS